MLRCSGPLVAALLLALLPVRPAPAQQPTPPDSATAAPLADSLRAALDRFKAASPPAAADSARLRRWADSLSVRGQSLRRSNPVYARHLLQNALAGHRALADSGGIASTMGEIGGTHYIQSQPEKARIHFQEALRISRTIGDQQGIADALQQLGIVHSIQGHFDQALTHYRASLDIQRTIGDRKRIANTVNNMGVVLQEQGRYDQALPRYRKALDDYQAIDDREGIASALGNLGVVYKNLGRYEEALDHLREMITINRDTGDRRDVAIGLNHAGTIHRLQGHPDRALARYRASLEMKRETGDRKGVAVSLNNIGGLHYEQGRYEEALDSYRASVTMSREVGAQPLTAVTLERIGAVSLRQGRLAAATDTLGRAVRLAEQLRTNATSPDARRSLLAKQIDAYRTLATAHVRAGRPDSALRSVEQARARLLADRLAGTATGDTSFALPSVAELRRTLGPDEAALLYANAGSEWPLSALVVTPDTTVARELPDSTTRAAIAKAYPTPLNRLRRAEGPLTAALGPSSSPEGGSPPSLAQTTRLYRHHLTRQRADASVRRDLARRLHQLLIEPVNRQIADKRELLVVPTGALGYLPFETLQDAEGHYLVEDKHVRYAQSLTVLRQLQRRHHDDRKRPLLALGGAAYERGTAPGGSATSGPLVAEARGGSTQVASRGHAAALLGDAERRMEQGRSPRPTYQQLGYQSWPALPGTGTEVHRLGTLTGKAATVITGRAASEDTVRAMSEDGRLANYRRVHFATHGVAVPEAPSLSALVLSQTGTSDSLAARDGYLTMEEIAGLEMRADVAVLSACQTGLGRIVAGEGVVSLSHAFLRAGANAALVSQWKVLDQSTRQFMTATYKRARADGTSFAEAVTETKRAFIAGEHGEKNKDPLRWAPFVYYGRK